MLLSLKTVFALFCCYFGRQTIARRSLCNNNPISKQYCWNLRSILCLSDVGRRIVYGSRFFSGDAIVSRWDTSHPIIFNVQPLNKFHFSLPDQHKRRWRRRIVWRLILRESKMRSWWPLSEFRVAGGYAFDSRACHYMNFERRELWTFRKWLGFQRWCFAEVGFFTFLKDFI